MPREEPIIFCLAPNEVRLIHFLLESELLFCIKNRSQFTDDYFREFEYLCKYFRRKLGV